MADAPIDRTFAYSVRSRRILSPPRRSRALDPQEETGSAAGLCFLTTALTTAFAAFRFAYCASPRV